MTTIGGFEVSDDSPEKCFSQAKPNETIAISAAASELQNQAVGDEELKKMKLIMRVLEMPHGTVGHLIRMINELDPNKKSI